MDKETLILVLKYFDEIIRPQIETKGIEESADAFLKFYEQAYMHHFSLPMYELTYQKTGRLTGKVRSGKRQKT